MRKVKYYSKGIYSPHTTCSFATWQYMNNEMLNIYVLHRRVCMAYKWKVHLVRLEGFMVLQFCTISLVYDWFWLEGAWKGSW